MSIIITNVKAIHTAPAGIPLVVVRIDTNQPGLYGLGCATYTQRWKSVVNVVDEYMKPFLVGKDAQRIEDIWQTANVSPYWRNGPVLNNALSGVDMALWDIKGKQAGLPLYQLFGGKCREAAMVYRHASGRTLDALFANIENYMEQGVVNIRCQLGRYGGDGHQLHSPEGALKGAYYDPHQYMSETLEMFEAVRSRYGFSHRFLHDVHERLSLADAIWFAKQLEPYRLLFLEDLLAPEQVAGFAHIRNQCATPLSMGELFNNPLEWRDLITERLIDYIRVHVSQIGGITPARKLALLCEAFGVRTAWHGPGDVSPIGHAANVHLDLASQNFGIQEWAGFNDALMEVFPGCPELRNGYVYLNDLPGIGVDINEELAAKYPCSEALPEWTMARLPDGTPVTP